MLTINFQSSYHKRSDNTKGFIYHVSGDEKELAEYVKAKTSQGLPEDKVKNKEGKVIMYSNQYIGKSAPLLKSEKGNYYADTTEHDIRISELRQIHTRPGVEATA